MIRRAGLGGATSGTVLASIGIFAMLLILTYSPFGGTSIPPSKTTASTTATATSTTTTTNSAPTNWPLPLSSSNQTAVEAQVGQFVRYLGTKNMSALLSLYTDTAVSSWTGNPIALTFEGAYASLGGVYQGTSSIGIAYIQLFQHTAFESCCGRPDWSVKLNANQKTADVVAVGSNAANATFGLRFSGEGIGGFFNSFNLTVSVEQEWVYHPGVGRNAGWSTQSETWNFTSYQLQYFMAA